VSEGLRTLVQDGLDKCLEGLTDLRQVLAVCGE
jgi:type II secretory ATPase GspE/PulE/Tfp pilus assembly ATPase PilB-like protein